MSWRLSRHWPVAGAVALCAAPAAAQERATITGRVRSDAGGPIAGASVILEGTPLGAMTQDDGRYTLTVPAAQLTGRPATLTARRLGYRASSVQVVLRAGETTHDFVLPLAPVQLEGTVVTALGIERDKRSLGVAQQTVSAQELTEARETNIVNALAGKAAGVQVTNAGPTGGSSRIVIRGANSITGNNQPLFVVDGIPVDNASPRNTGNGGIDYGNTAQDINPNDIESISVLKGPNAAALYGSRAANGAIVITTKTGRGARQISVGATQNLTFETPLRLPELQDVYGQGSGGQFAYKDGRGGGVNDNVNRSWGPKMDGRPIVQWWSAGQPAPWLPAPDNLRDLFAVGRTSTTNVAVTAGAERTDIRLGVTSLDQKGMYPTNTISRLNAALNGGAEITPRLNARASVQYVRARGQNRVGTGYDGAGNAFHSMIWGGRQRDTEHMREYLNPDGTQRSPNNSTVNNPYWIIYENPNFDTRDRVIGVGTVTYKATPWLTATLRSGTDWYRDWRKQEFANGNIATAYPGGAFSEALRYNRETNTDLLVTAERKAGALDLTLSAGGNQRRTGFQLNDTRTTSLVVPGTYNIANSAVTPNVTQDQSARRVNSLYAQAQVGWKNWLFTDVTARNDWSSTLPAGANSYFYPSVSTSFVFTDAIPAARRWGLGYGKLRASWTKVGNDADPYQLAVTYAPGTPFGSVPRFAVPNQIPNPALRPEKTTSWEAGPELRFLDDRVTVDATYYDKVTTDQIIPAQVSPTTGFTSAVLNAGTVRNRGVEVQLGLQPLRSRDGLSWDVTVNFARNRGVVTELYRDLQTVVLGTYWGLSIEARKGEPYGTFYGSPYLRDGQGRLVLLNGLPQADPQKRVLGHYTPDWNGGVQNRFRYKRLDLSFLVDTKQGGQIFSATEMFGRQSGVLKETLYGRENGQTLDEGGGIVLEGVNANGTPNTTKVTAQAYFNSLFQLHEANVFDASFVKLREVSLGYELPTRLTRRLGVSRAKAGLVGRNLWLHTGVPNVDPETAFDASNVQGIEYAQFPNARSVGFTINLTP